MVNTIIDDAWSTLATPLELFAGHVHVWRVQLSGDDAERTHFATLSPDEQRRANRFYNRSHGTRYTIAHSQLRRILSGYAGIAPAALEFVTEEHGKPIFAPRAPEVSRSFMQRAAALDSSPPPEGRLEQLHFNLSHSANLALVAVSRTGPVGVDVESWRPGIQHLAVAERFFSVRERERLQELETQGAVVRGFFTAWSRKEAYLKATGHGIARGLHHFDVTLDTLLPAQILEDRLDASAPDRWAMANIDVGVAYSAALVAARPVTAVKLFDADEIELPT